MNIPPMTARSYLAYRAKALQATRSTIFVTFKESLWRIRKGYSYRLYHNPLQPLQPQPIVCSLHPVSSVDMELGDVSAYEMEFIKTAVECAVTLRAQCPPY